MHHNVFFFFFFTKFQNISYKKKEPNTKIDETKTAGTNNLGKGTKSLERSRTYNRPPKQRMSELYSKIIRKPKNQRHQKQVNTK